LQLLDGFGHSSTASPPIHPTAGRCRTQYNRSSEIIVGHLTQLISEIHRMIDDPHQRVAPEFDLTAELSALQAAYEQIGNLRITLALHPAAIDVLTQQEAREILHIVREVLGTRVRETQVAQATVSIRKRGARICLRICDDGAGSLPVDGRMQGDRVALIKSRVSKIGGTVRTHVDEGQGTQLLVEFSLEPVLVSI
jgi:signal transduction histidine kinase